MNKEKVLKLIEIYERILHGKGDKIGLFGCYDTYYKGCWDDDLKAVKNLKRELIKKKG